MSRSIDLFIDAAAGLDDLASDLTRLTGNPLVPVPDAPMWVMRHGDVVAELSEHRFADDVNLQLSRYRYCLNARVSPGGRLEQTGPEITSLRSVHAALREAGFPALIVWDLHYRLDHRSGPGDGADELSLPPADLVRPVLGEPVP